MHEYAALEALRARTADYCALLETKTKKKWYVEFTHVTPTRRTVSPHIVVITKTYPTDHSPEIKAKVLDASSFTRHPEYGWAQNVEYTSADIAQAMRMMDDITFWNPILAEHDQFHENHRLQEIQRLISIARNSRLSEVVKGASQEVPITTTLTVAPKYIGLLSQVPPDALGAALSVLLTHVLPRHESEIEILLQAGVSAESIGVYFATSTISSLISDEVDHQTPYIEARERGERW